MALDATFKTYYTSFETEMTKAGSAYDDMLQSIETSFETYAVPVEIRAEFITQAHIEALKATQSNATRAALEIIAEEKKQEYTDAEIAKVVRDEDAYDDQLIIKAMDTQGSLSSFAVNVDSSTVQATIDRLKEIQDALLLRAGVTIPAP